MAKSKSNDVSTKLVKCSCKHDFQNNEYGDGLRLANKCKIASVPQYRCTVCDKVH